MNLSSLGAAPAAPGTVHLVGGGPGDPALVTVRAATLLATADLVAYDRSGDLVAMASVRRLAATDAIIAIESSLRVLRCLLLVTLHFALTLL